MPNVAARKASDVFVECLENEGVKHVFGIPGEETLDLNESLANSSVEFVPVRHEQGGAYIADVYGRLTGRAGVCLGTLGPGATNLVTAVADAFLDRAPLVALTGQGDLERMHKESHQYIDTVQLMRPITKWNARLSDPAIIPEVVRKAFKVAESEKPGATHIELPEDVMEMEIDAEPLPRRKPVQPEPAARELLRAADIIRGALNPVALAGNGVVRAGASAALREFVRSTGIPVAETFMGKGVTEADDPKSLGNVGLQSGDYAMAGFEEADVVIAIGYDLVEQSPKTWNPRRDKKIVCIDSLPAEIDDHYVPEVELIGDIYHVLSRLSEECRHVPHSGGSQRLRDIVLGRFEAAKDDDHFPMQPPRALFEIRKALGREDILVSDVGLHKLWIGRMFPAYEPNTVLIANGLGGHGLRGAGGDRGEARAPGSQGRGGERRRRLHDEHAGARDREAPRHAVRERDLGEPAVRLDRLEAGQEVRPPLRHRLHQPGLREARRVVRPARVALRVDRRLLGAPRPRARARRAVVDRDADRLLDRRGHFGGTRTGNGGDMSTATADEQSIVEGVPHKLYIGGEWRDGAESKTLEVEDPSTAETIAEVADATPDDAIAALAAAHDKQAEWQHTPPRDRGEILRRAFELISERVDDLALLMTLEMGKSLKESKAEITYGAEFFRWFSEEAVRIEGRFAVAAERRRAAARPCASRWGRAC